MAKKKQSELTVVTKAKDLCGYVITVTQKSPKHLRYTFVSRLQNLSMDVLEALYRANEVYVREDDPASREQRLGFQRQALTNLKLLCYMAELSVGAGCLLMKQYEQISLQATDCMNLLGAWMNSDRRRLSPQEERR